LGSSLGQVQPKTVKLVFVASLLSTLYSGAKAKTGFKVSECYKDPTKSIGLWTSHTCDRVALPQLEICKCLAGDLVS